VILGKETGIMNSLQAMICQGQQCPTFSRATSDNEQHERSSSSNNGILAATAVNLS